MDDPHAILTSEIGILRQVAVAFGIGQKQFKGVNRMLLARSASGETQSIAKLRLVHAATLRVFLEIG